MFSPPPTPAQETRIRPCVTGGRQGKYNPAPHLRPLGPSLTGLVRWRTHQVTIQEHWRTGATSFAPIVPNEPVKERTHRKDLTLASQCSDFLIGSDCCVVPLVVRSNNERLRPRTVDLLAQGHSTTKVVPRILFPPPRRRHQPLTSPLAW